MTRIARLFHTSLRLAPLLQAIHTSIIQNRKRVLRQGKDLLSDKSDVKSSEAERMVRLYAATEDGYNKALKALTQKFGSAKKVFPQQVHGITSRETTNLTQEGFSRYRDKYVLPLQTMSELGCTSISQFAASLALNNFDHNLRDEWTKHYKTANEIPSLDNTTKFLEPLENNIQFLTLYDQSLSASSSNKRHQTAGPKVSSSMCTLCKEPHKLFRCPVLQGYDTARRHRHIRDQNGCLNCLGIGYKAMECNSTFTCRECRGKHHTLLHRSTNIQLSNPSTAVSAPNLTAVEQLEKPASPTSDQTPPQISFLHTAMAKAIHQDRETLVQAALDTGASSSLITEKLASQLHLKKHPWRLSITGELTLQSTWDETQKITTKFNVVSHLP